MPEIKLDGKINSNATIKLLEELKGLDNPLTKAIQYKSTMGSKLYQLLQGNLKLKRKGPSNNVILLKNKQ